MIPTSTSTTATRAEISAKQTIPNTCKLLINALYLDSAITLMSSGLYSCLFMRACLSEKERFQKHNVIDQKLFNYGSFNESNSRGSLA
jgi:hypothetical protein